MDLGEHTTWMPLFSCAMVVAVLIAMPIMKALHRK